MLSVRVKRVSTRDGQAPPRPHMEGQPTLFHFHASLAAGKTPGRLRLTPPLGSCSLHPTPASTPDQPSQSAGPSRLVTPPGQTPKSLPSSPQCASRRGLATQQAFPGRLLSDLIMSLGQVALAWLEAQPLVSDSLLKCHQPATSLGLIYRNNNCADTTGPKAHYKE